MPFIAIGLPTDDTLRQCQLLVDGFIERVLTVRIFPVVLLACLLAAMPAAAQDFDIFTESQLAQNDGMSLSEAVESVRSQTDGRIVSAETRRNNGREVHHIKVLTKDGKVKTYKISGKKTGNG